MSAEDAVKRAVAPVPGETGAAYEALIQFIVTGGGTPLEFAARIGRERHTVWRWARRYGWKERARQFWRKAVPEWATWLERNPERDSAWRERAMAELDGRRKALAEREWATHEELLRIAESVIEKWRKGCWDRRAAPLGALAALVDLAFRLGRGGSGEVPSAMGGPPAHVLARTLDRAYR